MSKPPAPRSELRPRGASPWAQRGGVSPERVEGSFGDDFDEVLPTKARETEPGERVIELRFGATG